MSDQLPVSLEGVPQSLVDVAETFGLQVVFLLMEHFGGLDVQFPRNPPDDHPLVQALGQETGREVSHFLTGATIYIPHARGKTTQRAIMKLEKAGLDRSEIARTLGISQRHVRRVANAGGKSDPNQLDMFSDSE